MRREDDGVYRYRVMISYYPPRLRIKRLINGQRALFNRKFHPKREFGFPRTRFIKKWGGVLVQTIQYRRISLLNLSIVIFLEIE